MKIFLSFFAILCCSVTSQLLPDWGEALDVELFDDPRMHMNVIQMGKYYNYGAEAHDVVTDDGYILEVHRYTGNQTNPSPNGKQPVLLTHCLLCSSMDWAITGPGRGLDLGYDVWMTNVRGNRYSRRHTNTSIEKSLYWDFTFHEMGIYDLPATIDYVLKSTGYEKIFHVGHSQGTMTFFIMLSERPEYNDKIIMKFAMAPAAYISHIISPLFKILTVLDPTITATLRLVGKYDFNPTNNITQIFTSFLCNEKVPTQAICVNTLFLICGHSEKQVDRKLLPIILAHTPAGCSTKQILHLTQLFRSGYFRQFDYGPMKNLKKYKSESPPSYNLDNVKTPISLHYATNDWLATPADVEILHSKLPNVIGKFRVPWDQFNHLDFMWGLEVKALVYDQIISMMKSQAKHNVKK